MNFFLSKQSLIALPALLFIFLFSSHAYAQQGTVSVNFQNATLQQIIENLESRTPYKFIYAANLDLKSQRVTLVKEDVPIDEVLKNLQAQTSLSFKRDGNNIAVNKAEPLKKKGKLTGKVVDENGMSLPGASIYIPNSGVSTISGEDGSYTLSLEAGTYIVEFAFISYQTQKITGVSIIENDLTRLNVALKEDALAVEEVVVITQTYKQATATTEGMLLEQKKAAQFSDGISAEQIARTPDKDVGATLKRITGVTTMDDRFVVVRSMGDRWNQAVMDGISLPSTDAVQQQFSFDIIPTAVVESVVVSKTSTPDMYANFAGGYVEVRTKAIPKEDFTSFSIGSSFNTRSAFKDRLTKQQGSSDYFGFDDGTRSYPKGLVAMEIPTTQEASGPFIEQSKRFTNDNFTTYKTTADPGASLQFALGRSYELPNENRWGFIGSLIFRNTQEKLVIDHTERGTWMPNTYYSPGQEDVEYGTLRKYGFKNNGASYNFNSTLGGMFNAGIQLGNHKITIRNMLMHIYDNTLTQVTGWNYYNTSLEDVLNGTSLPFTEEIDYPVYQTFLQDKIEGEHKFGKLEVNWYAAYSTITKDTKDATFLRRGMARVGDDILIGYTAYNSDPNNFKRAYFNHEEDHYNAAINFKYRFNFSELFQNDIKTGYFGTYKKATNQQQSAMLAVVGQGTENVSINIPLSQLLDGSHYSWGGFGWQRLGGYGNAYIGDVKVHSPFIMLDNRYSNIVRLVWGVRAESYIYTQIASQSEDPAGFETIQRDEKVWQLLPSASLTISPTNTTNLRLGYNKSVLRPQFAERLNMPYYDPVRTAYVLNWTGGIVSTVVENYDFKAEWFPTRGEIVSVGVYKKNLQNPIEAVSQIGGDGGSRTIYNMNSHSAKLWGIEMEVYKNLSFLGEGKTLQRIYLYGNAALNDTKVTGYVNLDGTGGLYQANRPLYGQSPYNYNLGLDYIGERFGFSIRRNATGDQYMLVGFDYDAEEIRMPYAITDAQVSYRFLKEKNLEVRFSAKNLFDTPIETYNNFNSYSETRDYEVGHTNPRDTHALGPGATNRYDEGIDRKLFKAWSGRTLSFTLNYSFN